LCGHTSNSWSHFSAFCLTTGITNSSAVKFVDDTEYPPSFTALYRHYCRGNAAAAAAGICICPNIQTFYHLVTKHVCCCLQVGLSAGFMGDATVLWQWN